MCTDKIYGAAAAPRAGEAVKETQKAEGTVHKVVRRAALTALCIMFPLCALAVLVEGCSNKSGSIGIPSFGEDGLKTHQEVNIGGHKFGRTCLTKYQADGSVQVNCTYARADGAEGK